MVCEARTETREIKSATGCCFPHTFILHANASHTASWYVSFALLFVSLPHSSRSVVFMLNFSHGLSLLHQTQWLLMLIWA